MKCTLSWCGNKAHSKGLCEGHLSNLAKHGVPNPPLLARIVGRRTLLAKTCPDCGELKPMEAFGRQKAKGKWYVRPVCSPCKVIYNRSHRAKNPKRYPRDRSPESRAQRNRYMKNINDKSREKARKYFEQYTDADMVVLQRTDITSQEKARILGRTVRGVDDKIYKMRKAE